jgi:leucyl-tRNA synthetase
MDASQITAIESKWREKWADARAYEPDPDAKKEKRFVTAAFPYPNSPQHIGHGRTYTTADVYARYLRLQGYSVLFPMGFHVTGTPILAMAKRIAAKDPDVLRVFRDIYGIPDELSATLTEPKALVSHFSGEIEEGMKEMGYSIDWRRKFYSFDPKFNCFIQWQFRKLKQLGYLIKGEYPIAWCPLDSNAVSAHDTRGDVDPELEDVTVIKFATGGGASLVATTYRPETLYGVTNIWVNPKAAYVKAQYKNETIIIAKKAAEILDLQMGLKIIGPIAAGDIMKMRAKNPLTGGEVPVFPASFVSDEIGTGVVMSVPAHAPYDYLALRDLGKADMKMPQVVELKGYGAAPAKEEVEKLGVKNQDDPLAEQATENIYTKEAHEGVMALGKYKGEKAILAKEKIAKDLLGQGSAFSIVTIANGPVYCRCGGHVVVNVLKDQWFIDYGIPAWKAKAKQCLDNMRTIPEKSRDEYLYTIDWLKTRPCTRAAGLGTKFPFDESKMIEALSDSTLYMAFYTIAHMLKEFNEKDMDEAFFDAVILGNGPKAKEPGLKKLRESFLYWYPCDSRHSAGDLIRNHLTLYIFNHAAILDVALWPKQIVTNGFVLMDGAKMSKSMGNILPLRKAIKEYGADVIRFSVVSGADLSSDTDFSRTVAEGTRSRLAFIGSLIEATAQQKNARPHGMADKWLLSRLNRKIGAAKGLYENCQMRQLGLEIFYDVVSDLKWYEKRAESPNLHAFFMKWIMLISPFMPYHAEEYWHMLGGKGMAASGTFPEYDGKEVDAQVEMGEELVRAVHGDVEKISQLLGKKPQKIGIYAASDWKHRLYHLVREHKLLPKVMQEAAKDALLRPHMKDVPKAAGQLVKNAHSLPDVLTGKEELAALRDAVEFYKKEFGCEVAVEPEEKGTHPRAKNAMPGKPAIVLE